MRSYISDISLCCFCVPSCVFVHRFANALRRYPVELVYSWQCDEIKTTDDYGIWNSYKNREGARRGWTDKMVGYVSNSIFQYFMLAISRKKQHSREQTFCKHLSQYY